MSRGREYEAAAEKLLIPIAEANGVGIYDVEYVKEGSGWYLRAYIDKAGGVTIEDCERVSRALSARLDEEDFVQDAYILEVSSPGLGRTLKKEKHFQASLGREVELKTYRPIEGRKEFAGILTAYRQGEAILLIEGEEKAFAKADTALVRLALDF